MVEGEDDIIEAGLIVGEDRGGEGGAASHQPATQQDQRGVLEDEGVGQGWGREELDRELLQQRDDLLQGHAELGDVRAADPGERSGRERAVEAAMIAQERQLAGEPGAVGGDGGRPSQVLLGPDGGELLE